MTDTITIKEKAAVKARIGELNTHKQSVAALGVTFATQVTALTSALTATAGAGAEPVPGGVATKVQAGFDAEAAKLGTTSGKLQSWLDGCTVIQEEGATTVTQADGSTPKPTDPTPAPAPAPAPTKPAKPVLDYQLK